MSRRRTRAQRRISRTKSSCPKGVDRTLWDLNAAVSLLNDTYLFPEEYGAAIQKRAIRQAKVEFAAAKRCGWTGKSWYGFRPQDY